MSVRLGIFVTYYSPKKAGAIKGAFADSNIGANILLEGVCDSISLIWGKKKAYIHSGFE